MEPPSTPRKKASDEVPSTPTRRPPSLSSTSTRQRATRTSSSSSSTTPNLKILSQSPQLRSRLAALSLSSSAVLPSIKAGGRPVAADNIVVVEVGNRFVRVGIAGDSNPRCIIPAEFGWQRVAKTHSQYFSEKDNKQDKGRYFTLWDLRDLHDDDDSTTEESKENLHDSWYKSRPLKRFETVLECILRYAFSLELLTDPRQQRVAIVENPLWPSKIRQSIARVFLKHMQVSSIVFLPSPVLDLIAAGLRSGIVVDVGWEETIVYPVYDLRLLLMSTKSSIRGSKRLHAAVKEVLTDLIAKQHEQQSVKEVPFNMVEKVVINSLYTNGGNHLIGSASSVTKPSGPIIVPLMPGTSPGSFGSTSETTSSHRLDISRLLPAPPEDTELNSILKIPNHLLQNAVSGTFLLNRHYSGAAAIADADDDDELDLATMISRVICSLSMDVRGSTQSTIIFVGGASTIPGLQSKVLQDTRSLLRKRDIAAASSVMAAKSMGSWTGASLYMSSLAWFFAQDERIRLPGELSRERFNSIGYEKSTAPFGVIW